MARPRLLDEQYTAGRRGGGPRTVVKASYLKLDTASRAMRQTRTRSVVKANYRRVGPSVRQRLQRSADYYAHRPDADGVRANRLAFDATHDELGQTAAKALIDEAEGSYGYRLVLSPGRDFSEEELIDWTRGVMRDLETDLEANWIAYAHADQTEHPHVHVIAFTEERLEREDFASLREQGDWEASLVMTAWHHLERAFDDDDEVEVRKLATGGGGGGTAVAEILGQGMQQLEDEALRRRLELELEDGG